MTETGLLKKFDDKWKLKKDKCEEKRREMRRPHPIRVGEIMMLFIILGAGLSSAILAFGLEKIINRI